MPSLFHRNRPPSTGDAHPRRHAVKRFLVSLLILAAVAYGGLVAGIHLSPRVLPGNGLKVPGLARKLPYLAPPSDQLPNQRINVLILGLDERPGVPDLDRSDRPFPSLSANDPGLSDTMAVLSIDPETKTAAILSIPRDLWLDVPDGQGGWTTDRINSAYYVGEVDKLPGGGPAAAAAAITYNFGIPINHYLVLNFNGFMDVVDDVGGIDINVPNALTATVLPKDNSGGYEYTFFAGPQHMNGELALAYARFRLDENGDFGRIKRQQQVSLAVRQRLLSLGWLNNAASLFGKYNSAFQTDVAAYQVPGYALLAKQISSKSIVTRSLGEPGATGEFILPGSGADVLFAEPEKAATIVGDTFSDQSLFDATLNRLDQIHPPPGSLDVTPAGLSSSTTRVP